jgi:hypothetical protein
MPDVLEKVLTDWTSSLTETEARRKIFSMVRDIQYHICAGHFDMNISPAEILDAGKGFCLSKHYLLGELFSLKGYGVKYFTYEFRWCEAGLDLPEEIKALAETLPLTYHAACEVCIDGNWVLLDVAWDKGLKKMGFTVNEWDGFSDTVLAVKAGNGVSCKSLEEHQMFYHDRMEKYGLREKITLARFTKLFNSWLEDIRG